MSRGYMPKAKSAEHETPRDLFDELWEEFGGFDLDPACRPDHYTARRVLDAGGTIYVPPDQRVEHIPTKLGGPNVALPGREPKPTGDSRIFHDGLSGPWHGKVYMNPPYGLALRKWVPKAVSEVASGNAELVVALLPATTDTQWWQQYVVQRMMRTVPAHGGFAVAARSELSEVRFLKGRLKFGGLEGPAPKGSAIVVWRR